MHPKMHGVLPCENDQTKLDHFSRLACSTLLSKILAAVRLSGAVLDRGPSYYTQVSSNLLRSTARRFTAFTIVFARTF
jgi:hypothetical protein